MPARMWPQSRCAHVCVCAVVTVWHGQSSSRRVCAGEKCPEPMRVYLIESSLWLQNPALHLQPLPAGGEWAGSGPHLCACTAHHPSGGASVVHKSPVTGARSWGLLPRGCACSGLARFLKCQAARAHVSLWTCAGGSQYKTVCFTVCRC